MGVNEVNKKFVEVSDLELEKVNGGGGVTLGHDGTRQWAVGDLFTTSYRTGTFEVIFLMVSGLGYRLQGTTGSYTDGFDTLQPTYTGHVDQQ